MTGDLDDLLDDIAALEADDDEVDDFPWCDAARWSPAVVEWEENSPYGDTLPAFDDDGCVMVVDAERPWVVVVYSPPWWARG